MTYLNIIALLLLLVVPAYLLWRFDQALLRRMAIALARMLVQLAVLALATWLLWRYDHVGLSLLWLLAACVVAATAIVGRCQLSKRQLLLPVSAGVVLGVVPLTVYVVWLVIDLQPSSFAAASLVPVAGVLLAHTVATVTRGLGEYVSTLRTQSLSYYEAIGNGASRLKALAPYFTLALRTMVEPTVASLTTTALFAMPMLLAGMLLGGLQPLLAAGLFVALVVASIAASMLTLAATVWLLDRRLFDKSARLVLGTPSVALLLFIGLCACKQGDARQTFLSTSNTGNASVTVTPAPDAATGSDAPGVSEVTRQNVVRYELPAPLIDRPERIIVRKGYTTSYNAQTKTANWVAWHLTKPHTYGKAQRTNEKFTEDTSVAAPRATDNDYYNSRYDRGHLCPAGDNKWDATAMTETFLFTNICPQNHALNKYEWNDLEIKCREWARKYGAVDIVCGPVYYPDVAPRYIGRNKVRVPDALFKVVLCRQRAMAIGFVYKNDGKKVKMADAVKTVDQVEQLTHIDFFHQLDDKVERRVEAEASLSDW